MSEDKKTPEIIFAPGCFDSFEGTQEELDDMLAEIKRLVESGEIFERSSPVDMEALLEEFTDEELEDLAEQMGITEDEILETQPQKPNRMLH